MKILYYDCFAGISGDMHLGAMIDAGVDPDHLVSELNKLPLDGFRLNFSRDKRKSIEGTRVDVIIDDDQQTGNSSGQQYGHDHEHWHAHDHGLGHDHEHGHGHNHVHRNLKDIEEIVSKSGLKASTKERAMKMFQLIAKAEAKIHGMSVDDVHFHEVGAVDSIVDITGAAICIDYLAPDRILSSPVELGGGMIKCAHGTMPVPAPATSEILKNIPVKLGGTNHEATTPTGAAIIAANVNEFVSNPAFTPEKTAYGIGQRDTEVPNILRLIIARPSGPSADADSLQAGAGAKRQNQKMVIECNLDDMNPEWYPPVLEMLIEKGANDAFLTPSVMKKGRPGTLLTVLCEPELEEELIAVILKETTTIGVRTYPVNRTELERESVTFSSSLGSVIIKKCFYNGELLKWKPEFEDCRKLAEQHQLPIMEVCRIIHAEFEKNTRGTFHTTEKSQ